MPCARNLGEIRNSRYGIFQGASTGTAGEGSQLGNATIRMPGTPLSAPCSINHRTRLAWQFYITNVQGRPPLKCGPTTLLWSQATASNEPIRSSPAKRRLLLVKEM